MLWAKAAAQGYVINSCLSSGAGCHSLPSLSQCFFVLPEPFIDELPTEAKGVGSLDLCLAVAQLVLSMDLCKAMPISSQGSWKLAGQQLWTVPQLVWRHNSWLLQGPKWLPEGSDRRKTICSPPSRQICFPRASSKWRRMMPHGKWTTWMGTKPTIIWRICNMQPQVKTFNIPLPVDLGNVGVSNVPCQWCGGLLGRQDGQLVRPSNQQLNVLVWAIVQFPGAATNRGQPEASSSNLRKVQLLARTARKLKHGETFVTQSRERLLATDW